MLKKILPLILLFLLLHPAWAAAQEETGQEGTGPKRPPLANEVVERNKKKIREFIQNVDSRLYSLEKQGVKDFSCTVPIPKKNSPLGSTTEVVLLWKAPGQAAVKFIGARPKDRLILEYKWEPYFKDLTNVMAGVPYATRLADYDLALKEKGDWFYLTGVKKEKETLLTRKIEVKVDKKFVPKVETNSTTRSRKTLQLTWIFKEYEEKDGKLLPIEIEIKPGNTLFILYIEYQKADNYWVRSRSKLDKLNGQMDFWEYTNFKFNQGIEDTVFDKKK